MKIKTLYEDKDILAIEKPAGITVLDLVFKNYPKLELVHRLDKDTTGVLLLAKSEKAHQFLKKQFSERTVKKVYVAIVNGWVKSDHGIINKPIGRSPKDFRRRLAGRGVRGKIREAITEYRVIRRLNLPIDVDKKRTNTDIGANRDKIGAIGSFSLVELKPKTGRTHQIRVHMKFINHPVACDLLYNPKGVCPAGLGRLALHARSIEFQNLSGKIVRVESPLPKELSKVLA